LRAYTSMFVSSSQITDPRAARRFHRMPGPHAECG
jgi:hypothetical protein